MRVLPWLGKGGTAARTFCLNIPMTTAQMKAQSNLVVWGPASGPCYDPATIGDQSNEQFTLPSGGLDGLFKAEGEASELCAACHPNCCIEAAPCVAPACHIPHGWGNIFLLAFALAGVVYLGGGAFVARGAGLTGPADVFRLHPHRPQWDVVSELTTDGMLFTKRRFNAWRSGEKAGALPAIRCEKKAQINRHVPFFQTGSSGLQLWRAPRKMRTTMMKT